MKIAINGFGRIGKNIVRHLIANNYLAGQGGDLELIAINDLGTAVQVYSNPNNNKTFKVSNILLYGPPSGGGGAE